MFSALTTQLVGSYTKPHWLAHHDRARALDDSWWRPEAEVLQEAREDAARLAIYEQAHVGLDLITDGEAQRSSYDRHFLHGLSGLDFTMLDHIRVRDEVATRVRHGESAAVVSWDGPRVVAQLAWQRSFALPELRFLKSQTTRAVKIAVPGPLTLSSRVSDRFYGSDKALILALADCINKELQSLDSEGASALQIDEPAFHTRLSLARRYGVEAISRAVNGIRTPVIVHACYGYAFAYSEKQANPAYAEVASLLASCPISGISLEYEQPGHTPELLAFCGQKHVVLGLLNLGTHVVETPEHVASRLRAAAEVVPASRLHPAPDCGMWFLPRRVAYGKVQSLVQGTRIMRARVAL